MNAVTAHPRAGSDNEQVTRSTWPLCSKCRCEPAAPGQRWGRACASAYMREYRRRGVPRKFRWFVIQRAAELGIVLPADFFDAPDGEQP